MRTADYRYFSYVTILRLCLKLDFLLKGRKTNDNFVLVTNKNFLIIIVRVISCLKYIHTQIIKATREINIF